MNVIKITITLEPAYLKKLDDINLYQDRSKTIRMLVDGFYEKKEDDEKNDNTK